MTKAVAIRDIMPLYTEPSADSELADEVLFGMTVEAEAVSDTNFCRVKTHYRYEGYAHADDLYFGENAEMWETRDKFVCSVRYLDIKDSPEVQAKTSASLPMGGLLAELAVPENTDDGWTCIEMPDGKRGYVRSCCIKRPAPDWRTEDEDSVRAAVIASAMKYTGTQYRWGGKTGLGIDCSGLASVSYLLNGIIIYRDASIADGFEIKEIPFESVKPADLIFFPGHVAVYLGNNEYIHSTGHKDSQGVTINSFDPESPVYRADLAETEKKGGSIFPDN